MSFNIQSVGSAVEKVKEESEIFNRTGWHEQPLSKIELLLPTNQPGKSYLALDSGQNGVRLFFGIQRWQLLGILRRFVGELNPSDTDLILEELREIKNSLRQNQEARTGESES